MWLESFRQFLNCSLQRIEHWARELDLWPAWLVRGSPDAPEPGRSDAPAAPVDWHADLSYSFRSLQCHLRVGVLEPTPGMKVIRQALQGRCER